MGFMDILGKAAKGAMYVAEKAIERGEAQKQKVLREVEIEKRRNSNLSNKEVMSKGRNAQTAAQKIAAAQTLKERGVEPKKKKVATTPAYRKGDDPSVKTAIVLSAPGRHEKEAGRPAAAETGKTLQTAIEQLHSKDPNYFPSNKLDDYTIVNAAESIEYKTLTGRTEATEKEIRNTKNVSRVKEALKGADKVVTLGNKAEIAVDASGFSGDILSSGHPSKQSLNKKYKSDAKTPSERNSDRIKQWANEIVDKENS